jgi:DNA polymerase I-like protein with 3'-5' exonuclease and polymerase domains
MLIKKYGWQPVEYTKKTGEPKIDDEILAALEYPEAQQLSHFMMLNKRVSQIAEGNEGWLKHVTDEGRIHGAVNTMGAVTRRMAHFKPNLGQVPAGYSPYGPECRELFGPRYGWKQVGIDADGLEMACLGHFMQPFDNGAFITSFKEGNKKDGTDPHSRNAQSLDRDRDTAKTFFYAYIYGAGNGKLGAICGGGLGLGKAMRTKFEKGTPALGLLVDAVKSKARSHGYLMSLDKHPIPIRSLHSALNTLCQGAGAIIMKKALCILDSEIQNRGYAPGADYEFMVNVHDEWQIECRPEIADEIGKLGCEAITQAGEHFQFRCPLSGSYKVGNTWAETH